MGVIILRHDHVYPRVEADSTRVVGTRGAMEVYQKLLGAGLGVYVPTTYTGHDCIIKNGNGYHVDIEVKTRSRNADPVYSVEG